MNATLAINAPSAIMKIASLIARLCSIYSYAIIIRVLLSWTGSRSYYDQYGRPVSQDRPVYDFLCKITDPYMNFFRSKNLTIGRIDYSPLFALMVLNIVKSAFQIIGSYGKISIALLLAVILQNLWSYIASYILLIVVIMLAIRWYCGRKLYDPRYRNAVNNFDRILQIPVNFVFRLFYKNKTVSEQKLIVTSFLFYLGIYLLAKYGFRALIGYLVQLQ